MDTKPGAGVSPVAGALAEGSRTVQSVLPAATYEELRFVAEANFRSVSREVLVAVDAHLTRERERVTVHA